VRQAIAVLLETKDARELGLLKAPSAATLRALEAETAIEAFLLQTSPSPPHDTLRALRAIAGLLQPVDITT